MHMQIGYHASCTCALFVQRLAGGRSPLHPSTKNRAGEPRFTGPPRNPNE